jgi:hypothetical protein
MRSLILEVEKKIAAGMTEKDAAVDVMRENSQFVAAGVMKNNALFKALSSNKSLPESIHPASGSKAT